MFEFVVVPYTLADYEQQHHSYGKAKDPTRHTVRDVVDALLFLDLVRFCFTAVYMRATTGEGVLVTDVWRLKFGSFAKKPEIVTLDRDATTEDDDVDLIIRRGFDKNKTLCMMLWILLSE